MTSSVISAVKTSTRLTWEDIVIVGAYFVAVIIVGLYASCRASRNTVSGYFLAGRSMMFYTVGASLFVSNIGSEHFIGLAGSGAAGGIGVGAWEFNAILLIQLLGFVFAPVYIACQTATMPEYLKKRFGGQRIRVYFAVLSLILYIFTKCSVNLYTGALFIQQSLGWDLYLSIIVQIAVVAVLTITGGLTAVIYTDTLQAVLMISGALALMGKGFYEVGGFNELWRRYPLAVTNITVPNTTCHLVSPNWNVMLREPSDPDMPWPGFLFGQTPGSIWYWCSDQVIVQRVLASKSLSHAQGATILAGFAKILPLFMMVMPGIIARVLYTDEVACVDPEVCWETCQSRTGCSNIAYPKLVLGIMPKGARGIMMAVMLAALMSDLDSIFNSASAMFTIDIYKSLRPKAGNKELMIIGRLFVVVMVGAAIAWVPVVKETQGGQVFIYIQEVSLYLAPPVACIYLLAILWPRCNEKGAFWGLMAGLVTGVTRLILVFIYKGSESCGEVDTRPAIIKDFQYMYFAVLLFWITFFVAVTVSLLTAPPAYKHLYRTTFWTRYDKVTDNDIDQGNIHPVWDRLSLCFKTTESRESQTEFDNAPVDLKQYEGENTNSYTAVDAGNNGVLNDGSDDLGRQGFEMDIVKHTMQNENSLAGQDFNNVQTESADNFKPSWTKLLYRWACGVSRVTPQGYSSDLESGVKVKPSWKELFYSWVCGVSPEGHENDIDLDLARAREERICSLEQNETAKYFLFFC